MTIAKEPKAMHYLISAMLAAVGIIHLLPLSGVLGAERLAVLYGMSFNEPNLAILMRHRAVLFGMLGAFLWLAWSVGGYNPQLARVFLADVVALACLAIGAATYAYLHMRKLT